MTASEATLIAHRLWAILERGVHRHTTSWAPDEVVRLVNALGGWQSVSESTDYAQKAVCIAQWRDLALALEGCL